MSKLTVPQIQAAMHQIRAGFATLGFANLEDPEHATAQGALGVYLVAQDKDNKPLHDELWLRVSVIESVLGQYASCDFRAGNYWIAAHGRVLGPSSIPGTPGYVPPDPPEELLPTFKSVCPVCDHAMLFRTAPVAAEVIQCSNKDCRATLKWSAATMRWHKF
jgi:hypothetical protein